MHRRFNKFNRRLVAVVWFITILLCSTTAYASVYDNVEVEPTRGEIFPFYDLHSLREFIVQYRILWIVVGVSGILHSRYYRWRRQQIREGISTMATVVGYYRPSNVEDAMDSYSPIFEYYAQGEKRTAKCIDYYKYKRYSMGQQVAIHYLEKKPHKVLIDDEPEKPSRAIIVYCVLIALGVFAYFL